MYSFSSCGLVLLASPLKELVIKKIQTSENTISLHQYSDFDSISPSFLVVITDDKTDTICASQNLGDIALLPPNNLTLYFCGTPMDIHYSKLKLPTSFQKYNISVDTTYKGRFGY